MNRTVSEQLYYVLFGFSFCIHIYSLFSLKVHLEILRVPYGNIKLLFDGGLEKKTEYK